MASSPGPRPTKIIKKPKTAGRTFALFVVSVAMFSDVFIYGLVVPVMPFALRERIHIPDSRIQSTNSLLLGVLGSATTIGSLVAGVLSDKYQTRRVPFFVGLLSLFASTVLFAVATNLSVLIVARLFQGLSTAVVCTVGYALLADKYDASSHDSESKGFGAAMGWVSTALSLGWFVGPIAGGLIYDHGSYALVFVPALACVAVEILLLLRLFAGEREEKEREQKLRIQGVESTAKDGNDNHSTAYQSTPTSAGSIAVPTLPLPPVGAIAPSESTPLLPKSPTTNPTQQITTRPALLVLLSSPHLVASILALTICDALLTSFDAVLPVYLNETYNLTSEQISLVFIALVLPLCSGPIFGGLAERLTDGMRRLTCAGFVLSGVAFAGMGWLDGYDNGRKSNPGAGTQAGDASSPELAHLLPLLVFTGCSFALALTPLTTSISHRIGAIEQASPGVFGPTGANATAYGLAHVGLGIGLVLGPMGSGYLKERFGWSVMCWVWVGVCVLGLVLGAFGVRGGARAEAEVIGDNA